MRKILVLTVLAAMGGTPSLALADDLSKCGKCDELPDLEGELFFQEKMQKGFKEYVDWRSPTAVPGEDIIQSMVNEINPPPATPAGQAAADAIARATDGKSGQAELGTDPDSCKLVIYLKDAKGNNIIDPRTKKEKTKPFDESAYRKAHCKAVADYLIAHENQHVADCKAGKTWGAWQTYAAADVRAYSAGIRNLRAYIRQKSIACKVEGSYKDNPTKPNPNDQQDEPTVPTPDALKQRLDALKKGRK